MGEDFVLPPELGYEDFKREEKHFTAKDPKTSDGKSFTPECTQTMCGNRTNFFIAWKGEVWPVGTIGVENYLMDHRKNCGKILSNRSRGNITFLRIFIVGS